MTNEYLLLFSAVTDAISRLEELQELLIHAQQGAEELYISREEG